MIDNEKVRVSKKFKEDVLDTIKALSITKKGKNMSNVYITKKVADFIDVDKLWRYIDDE